MTPLYVGYFTPRYAEEATGLVESLRAFGLEHHVCPVADLGSWEANTSHKPAFVREMMLRHEGRPLVYVDADARVRRYPELLDRLNAEGVDFAAHWKDGWELLSGTLFFGSTPAAWTLVQAWIAECAAWPDVWDQTCLQRCVERAASLVVRRIPPAYCQIFDSMGHHGQPVIEHLQASRRLAVHR